MQDPIPIGTNSFSCAQSLTPCSFFPVPQCWRSLGVVRVRGLDVPLAGAKARKTYRCFPVFGGGPGGLYGMSSSAFARWPFSVTLASLSRVRFAAIQWHISDHLGSLRDGASGSVRVRTKLEVVLSLAGTSRPLSERRDMLGACWSSSGEMVFPN